MTWGVPLLVSYHFALSYCSWGSQGKNTEVACHSLLQWTMKSTTQMEEQTRNTEVQINEEEIDKLPEKNSE